MFSLKMLNNLIFLLFELPLDQTNSILFFGFIIISSLLMAYIMETESFLNSMLITELFYFFISLLFIFNSEITSNFIAELISLFFIILAAAESAVGLSLLVFLKKSSSNFLKIGVNNSLRG